MVATTVRTIKRILISKIEPGEDISDTIERVVRDNGVLAGQLSLIGAVSRVRVGYFDVSQRRYHENVIERGLEVVSCMGNISRLEDGTPIVHAHIVVADENGVCYGGHMMSGCRVSVTAELMIMEFDETLTRKRDERSGLNLLYLQ